MTDLKYTKTRFYYDKRIFNKLKIKYHVRCVSMKFTFYEKKILFLSFKLSRDVLETKFE